MIVNEMVIAADDEMSMTHCRQVDNAKYYQPGMKLRGDPNF